MHIIPNELIDSFLMDFSDESEFVFNNSIFEKKGIHFIQDNLVFSKDKNTFRGMHFQKPPFEQGKLIWCTKGMIRDIIVDFRRDSPTYLQVYSVILSENNSRMLFVPRGFLHGYETLSDNTIIEYKVDNDYMPDSVVTINVFDDELKIELKSDKPIMNERDKKGLNIKNITSPFLYKNKGD